MQTECNVSLLEITGVAVVWGSIIAPESCGQGPVEESMKELESGVWKRGLHWLDHGAPEKLSDSGVTPPHWTISTASSLRRAKAGGKEEHRITL